MVDKATVLDLKLVLAERVVPAVTRWNRLEGRPRAHAFDRALKAEVRDALWMLSKQWQMGEFEGDDAGSPALARICLETATFDRYQAAQGTVEAFSLAEPLETKVERRPIAFRAGNQRLAFDVRGMVARRWRKMLKAAFDAGDLTADYRDAYRARYPIAVPDPTAEVDAPVCAHAEAWQQVGAMAERVMDGVDFLEHLDAGGAVDDGVGAAAADVPVLAAMAARLEEWLADLIAQPADADSDAWIPNKLEYQFGCSAAGGASDVVARAEEYYQGHLDWYALERTGEKGLELPSGGPPPTARAQSFLPVGLVFAGMPNTRWWEFEDRKTNLGAITPDTVDIGTLLLVEFGLVYANDWFVFPLAMPLGSMATVRGIAVTNVFGERIWVEAASDRPALAGQRWSVFQMTSESPAKASLALLPTAAKVQNGKPLEEVALVRDEMANMVWGIEKLVPLPSGASKPGREVAREHFAALERIVGPPPAPPEPKAPIRYEVMNTVPEHWIPFVPVHLEGSDREVRLQRAAMPRLLGTDPGGFQKVRPRTSLLRQNLPKAYFVDEEEVTRAGALVRVAYQRTRWLDGKPFVWLGASKLTGRGEGSSGLAFDRIVDSRAR